MADATEAQALAQNPDDPRIALSVLPDPDGDGYHVSFVSSEQTQVYEVPYDVGGRVLDSVLNAVSGDNARGYE